jgi:FkbM family methyltransferase
VADWRVRILRLAFAAAAAADRLNLPRPALITALRVRIRRALTRALLGDRSVLAVVNDVPMHLHPQLMAQYVARRHEPTTTRLFRRACTDGMVVLDIGASVGYYTLLAARRVGQAGAVYAFEPHPASADLLRRNVHRAGLRNVTLVPKGVSDVPGHAVLFTSAGLPETSSLHERAVPEAGGVVSVECVTIDDYLSTRHVDVVKVDVEGHEAAVLEGMRATLAGNPEVILFVECNPTALGHGGASADALLSLLHGQGFSVAWIDEEHGQAVPVDDAAHLPPYLHSAERRYVNLLCRRPQGVPASRPHGGQARQ